MLCQCTHSTHSTAQPRASRLRARGRDCTPEVEEEAGGRVAIRERVLQLVDLLLHPVVAHRVPQRLHLAELHARHARLAAAAKHRAVGDRVVDGRRRAVRRPRRGRPLQRSVERRDCGVSRRHVPVVRVAQAVEEAHRALDVELERLLPVRRVEQVAVRVAPHPAHPQPQLTRGLAARGQCMVWRRESGGWSDAAAQRCSPSERVC